MVLPISEFWIICRNDLSVDPFQGELTLTALSLYPTCMLPTPVTNYFLFGKIRSAIQGFAGFGKFFPGIVTLIFIAGITNQINAGKIQCCSEAANTLFPGQDQCFVNGPGEGNIKNDVYGWMALTAKNVNADNLQESYIFLNPESTSGFDLQFDAVYSQGDGPRFYSIAGGKALFSNDIPSLTDQTEIQFIFIPNNGTDFQIEASGLEMMPLPVFLYDKKSRSDQDLAMNSVYSFIAQPGDDSTRFVLHFGVTGIQQPEEPAQFNVYYSASELHYSTLSNTDVLTVTSMDGREIRSFKTGNIGRQNSVVSLKSGAYIVQLVSGNKCFSKKILIAK